MSEHALPKIEDRSQGIFHPSISDLRLDWIRTLAILEERSDNIASLPRISSDCEFAAAAWKKRLRSWCRDLDELLVEYPLEASRQVA